MNQDFKLNFDSLPDDYKGVTGSQTFNSQSDMFDSPDHVRNICFAWPDGKMKFMNYAYLVSGEYLPDDGTIILAFTTDTIIIKGSLLNLLFADLMSHLPRMITCIGQRYSQTVDNAKPLITAIEILAGK